MNARHSVESRLWLPGLLVLGLMACTRAGQAQLAPPMTTLHSFNGNDGIMFEPNVPWSGYSVLGSGLIQGKDGNLYAATPYGGAAAGIGDGTLFKITTKGVFTSLYSFSGSDGFEPNGVILGKDGALYGTTVEGGANPNWWVLQGTVFKFTLSGTLTTLKDFSLPLSQGGMWPYAGLVQAKDGSLYGSTAFGAGGIGPIGDGYGSLFKIRPDGSGFKTLYAFSGGTEGTNVWAALTQGEDGALYGTNYGYAADDSGFEYLSGSVYRITPAGAVTVLHTFGSNDGIGNVYVGFKINSDRSLTLTVPAGAPSARITIYNPFGKGLSSKAFKVTP